MATIKDVAKLAGVSVSTVSIVLNNKSNERKISSETCEKVRWAINELGYQPNVSARKLRTFGENKPVIAFYWPMDVRSNSLGWVLKCLQDAFDAMYFERDIMVCSYKNGHLKDDVRFNDNNSFSAILIGGTTLEDMEYMESLTFTIPVVLFSRYSEKFCSVYGDDELLGKIVAENVFANGYRKVAVISTSANYSNSKARVKSFLNTCDALGIEIPEDCRIVASDTTADGYEAGYRLTNLSSKPQFVFCQTDTIALGVIHALSKCGVRVPEDISLMSTGFLSPVYTEYSNPSISVVSVPVKNIATECAQILVNLLNHRITSVIHHKLEPIAIERDSCKILKKTL